MLNEHEKHQKKMINFLLNAHANFKKKKINFEIQNSKINKKLQICVYD